MAVHPQAQTERDAQLLELQEARRQHFASLDAELSRMKANARAQYGNNIPSSVQSVIQQKGAMINDAKSRYNRRVYKIKASVIEKNYDARVRAKQEAKGTYSRDYADWSMREAREERSRRGIYQDPKTGATIKSTSVYDPRTGMTTGEAIVTQPLGVKSVEHKGQRVWAGVSPTRLSAEVESTRNPLGYTRVARDITTGIYAGQKIPEVTYETRELTRFNIREVLSNPLKRQEIKELYIEKGKHVIGSYAKGVGKFLYRPNYPHYEKGVTLLDPLRRGGEANVGYKIEKFMQENLKTEKVLYKDPDVQLAGVMTGIGALTTLPISLFSVGTTPVTLGTVAKVGYGAFITQRTVKAVYNPTTENIAQAALVATPAVAYGIAKYSPVRLQAERIPLTLKGQPAGSKIVFGLGYGYKGRAVVLGSVGRPLQSTKYNMGLKPSAQRALGVGKAGMQTHFYKPYLRIKNKLAPYIPEYRGYGLISAAKTQLSKPVVMAQTKLAPYIPEYRGYGLISAAKTSLSKPFIAAGFSVAPFIPSYKGYGLISATRTALSKPVVMAQTKLAPYIPEYRGYGLISATRTALSKPVVMAQTKLAPYIPEYRGYGLISATRTALSKPVVMAQTNLAKITPTYKGYGMIEATKTALYKPIIKLTTGGGKLKYRIQQSLGVGKAGMQTHFYKPYLRIKNKLAPYIPEYRGYGLISAAKTQLSKPVVMAQTKLAPYIPEYRGYGLISAAKTSLSKPFIAAGFSVAPFIPSYKGYGLISATRTALSKPVVMAQTKLAPYIPEYRGYGMIEAAKTTAYKGFLHTAKLSPFTIHKETTTLTPELGWQPKTAVGTQYLIDNADKLISEPSSMLVEGKSISPELARETTRKGIEAVRDLSKTKSKYWDKEKYFSDTEVLTGKETKIVHKIIAKHAGKEFGSFPTRPQLHTDVLRSIKDIEAQFKIVTPRGLQSVTKDVYSGLKAGGSKVRLPAGDTYTIEKFTGGKWQKAVELKGQGFGAGDVVPDKALSFNLWANKDFMKKEGGVIAMARGELKRKAAGVFGFREEGTIGVTHTGRYKDLADLFRISYTLQKSRAIPSLKAESFLKMQDKLGLDIRAAGVTKPLTITLGSASPSPLTSGFMPVLSPSPSPSPYSPKLSPYFSASPSPSPYSPKLSPYFSASPSPSPYSPSPYFSASPYASASPSPYSASPSASPSPSPYSPSPSPSPSPYPLSPRPPPPPPVGVPFRLRGIEGITQAKRKKRRLRQPRGYVPTLTSISTGLVGKPSKAGIKTGLGLRPMLKMPKMRVGF